MTETKWMYALFDKQIEFWSITSDGELFKMLIRADTLCKLEEIKSGVLVATLENYLDKIKEEVKS